MSSNYINFKVEMIVPMSKIVENNLRAVHSYYSYLTNCEVYLTFSDIAIRKIDGQKKMTWTSFLNISCEQHNRLLEQIRKYCDMWGATYTYTPLPY